MKKLTDIFANWRKGKEEHDRKVADSEYSEECLFKALNDRLARDRERLKTLNRINPILDIIKTYRLADDKDLEAKQWQILAEYAQDQVKALTQEDKPQFNVSATLDGSTIKTVIERAEKRHGYGIDR